MKPIPTPFVVNTGEQEKVQKTIDDFFVETKEFIGGMYEVQEWQFQINSGEIAYHNMVVTDDRITYLVYGDIVLASVFETRTEFNHVRYTFFRNLDGFGELAPKN